MSELKVLDLFSGCGGLSEGFQLAGYRIIMGVDNWDVALRTFEKNHSDSVGRIADLSNLDPKDLKLQDKIDVIIGGPPCQGFSIAGKREAEDPRNKLYQGFVNCVEHFNPKAFVMENVPNLISMNGGQIKNSIIKDFEKLGYKVVYKILKASDYGVPQQRRRVFFVGLNDSEKDFVFPMPFDVSISTKEAISDLPEHSVVDGDQYPTKALSAYQKEMRRESVGVFNHQISNHSDKTKQIISMVPDGGNFKDLPKELQGTRNVNIAWTRFAADKPSHTIDTGHRHHFHYKYNRIPTVRESARLQSFRDDFIFLGSKTNQYKQVGNAVPPKLAEQVAIALKGFLE